VGTATSAVALPYVLEKQVLFYGALSGGDVLRKSPPDRYVFNFRPSLRQETASAVRYLVDVRRIRPTRIAVLTQDDDFGASGWAGAAEQLASHGVPPGRVLRLTYPRNTADVSAALARLKARAQDIDAVVLVATYKPAAAFIRRTKDARLQLVSAVVSADSNGLAEELATGGARFTQDVVVTQVVPLPTSRATAVLRYQKALEKHALGEKPGSTTLEAWAGATVFLEALKRAGPELDTERLVAALESIQGMDMGIGTQVKLGPADHQASDKVWGWQMQPDGTYAQVDLE
jgi:branched-chain amino acid transport system substrate-binding protein